LFLPGGSCVALQLQLCLVSSSSSKVGQFSFECLTRSALGSTTFPTLGGWPVTPPLLSAFVPPQPLLGASGSSGRLACHYTSTFNLCCFTCICSLKCGAESSAPCPTPVLWDKLRVPPPPPLLVLDYSSLFFSFIGGDSVCPGTALDYVPRGVVRKSCVVFDSADSSKQLWSQLVGRIGAAFLSVA
jgi:hypothetical protein